MKLKFIKELEWNVEAQMLPCYETSHGMMGLELNLCAITGKYILKIAHAKHYFAIKTYTFECSSMKKAIEYTKWISQTQIKRFNLK
jgi:hypothetical protein